MQSFLPSNPNIDINNHNLPDSQIKSLERQTSISGQPQHKQLVFLPSNRTRVPSNFAATLRIIQSENALAHTANWSKNKPSWRALLSNNGCPTVKSNVHQSASLLWFISTCFLRFFLVKGGVWVKTETCGNDYRWSEDSSGIFYGQNLLWESTPWDGNGLAKQILHDGYAGRIAYNGFARKSYGS